MIEKTIKIFECEYCNKISKTKAGMSRHEAACRCNPAKRGLCYYCEHFKDMCNTEERIDYYIDTPWGGPDCYIKNMNPHECTLKGQKLFNGVKREELLMALLDADWIQMPTFKDGCAGFILKPNLKENYEAIQRLITKKK